MVNRRTPSSAKVQWRSDIVLIELCSLRGTIAIGISPLTVETRFAPCFLICLSGHLSKKYNIRLKSGDQERSACGAVRRLLNYYFIRLKDDD